MKVVYKTADTERFSDTVATADPDLNFSLEANSTYLIRGHLRFRGGTVGDLKHGFSSGDADIVEALGQTWKWRNTAADTTQTASCNGAAWWTGHFTGGVTRAVSMTNGSYSTPVEFSIILTTGDTGGTFAVIWAQNTIDATYPTVLLAESIMTYEKLTV